MAEDVRWRHGRLPRWILPALAALAGAAPWVGPMQGWYPAELAWRLALLTVEPPLVFWFFCNVFEVGLRRELSWAAAYAVSTGAALAAGGGPVVWVVAGQLGLAGWLCLSAWRDGFVQLRRALVALDRGEMERANRAYGRYMMLGQTLERDAWTRLRETAIRDPAALRPRFAGMVNACRYGDKHGLGDQAYAGLFPERDTSRASAEEG